MEWKSDEEAKKKQKKKRIDGKRSFVVKAEFAYLAYRENVGDMILDDTSALPIYLKPSLLSHFDTMFHLNPSLFTEGSKELGIAMFLYKKKT
jgi:hypothetical protein